MRWKGWFSAARQLQVNITCEWGHLTGPRGPRAGDAHWGLIKRQLNPPGTSPDPGRHSPPRTSAILSWGAGGRSSVCPGEGGRATSTPPSPRTACRQMWDSHITWQRFSTHGSLCLSPISRHSDSVRWLGMSGTDTRSHALPCLHANVLLQSLVTCWSLWHANNLHGLQTQLTASGPTDVMAVGRRSVRSRPKPQESPSRRWSVMVYCGREATHTHRTSRAALCLGWVLNHRITAGRGNYCSGGKVHLTLLCQVSGSLIGRWSTGDARGLLWALGQNTVVQWRNTERRVCASANDSMFVSRYKMDDQGSWVCSAVIITRHICQHPRAV